MSIPTCAIDSCDRRARTRGWCLKHYERWLKHGDPLFDRKPGGQPKAVASCAIAGCSNRAISRGWCDKHWTRWRNHGDPLHLEVSQRGTMLERARYGATCLGPGPCVEVARRVDYRPTMRFRGKRANVSRVAWILANGDPGDRHVLHTCDNDHCVRLGHLYLGDNARNVADKVERIRFAKKLEPADVWAIRDGRASGRTQMSLAREFNVSQATVADIISGRTWWHLTEREGTLAC